MAEFVTPEGQSIAYDVSGNGPPVLLLHGFPQSRVMWDPMVPDLERDFTIVTADLRGYGASGKPRGGAELYTFGAMGGDMLALMSDLGFDRFHLVGHDRGARVAYRMALDAGERLLSLTVMDIVPTDYLVDNITFPASKAYFHWSLMSQPSPLPERMIGGDPDLFFETCLVGWGVAHLTEFRGLGTYREVWREPDAISAMCNDYRAGVTLDAAADRADRGRQVTCPSLVLYGQDGVMADLYDVPAVWSERLSDMQSAVIPGGHFFPDQSPKRTTAALRDFLSRL